MALNESEIHEEFIRASGPGGQNVNKVASAVQLYFDISHSTLPVPVRARLIKLAGKRVNTEGVLVIDAHRYRTQAQNRADARTRLIALIRHALVEPKTRRKTKPTRGAHARRLKNKKRRAEIKKLRRGEF
ncbi:MAG: aminoacyl-tRNA hydrolase [Chloroflexi bacterium]|nr:aminoacyl-tRNA hydrolase [Chloroflexota bacterium]